MKQEACWNVDDGPETHHCVECGIELCWPGDKCSLDEFSHICDECNFGHTQACQIQTEPLPNSIDSIPCIVYAERITLNEVA